MRERELIAFLTQCGWQDATRIKLAGDASNRRYERLQHPSLGNAVLMDAPPATNSDTRDFVKITKHLQGLGLSAPRVFAQNLETGFLLLEDLGDDLLAQVSQQDPTLETTVYISAADTLVTLQSNTPPDGLAAYDVEAMAETALLAMDWYLAYAAGPAQHTQRDRFHDLVRAALDAALTGPPVITLRDYHAENLIWLPYRKGPARTGLLDFQTAMLGHPAYDLASLLKDARRDVSPVTRDATLAHFLSQSGHDPGRFGAAFATASAQRNLRILGGFARLSIRDGKRHYPDLIPRVWNNLMDDLTHRSLADLQDFVSNTLPEPSPDIIARLKSVELSHA